MINGKIVKRDGSLEEFNLEYIIKAAHEALIASYPVDFNKVELKSIAEVAANKVRHEIIENKEKWIKGRFATVDELNRILGYILMELGEYKTAEAFIEYRKTHAEQRSKQGMIDEVIDIFEDYIEDDTKDHSYNANMSYSLQGLNNKITEKMTKNYWLNKIYPAEIKNLHENGDIHIHDLGAYAPYCCGWSLEDLLIKGFGGVVGKVESAPPKHFKTALGQLVNFIYTLQGEAAGAQAVSNFDTLLAPFIREDGLNYKQVKQAMQEFVYNSNVPTRVGFQTPFFNITMDVVVPNGHKDTNVIIGGQRQKGKTYSDYQEEINMINKAFCEVMSAGDAQGRIFSFPIPTYNITDNMDWDNPVLDDIFEMTAKYGIPTFANYKNSDLSPEDARSMCCRLRIDHRELVNRGGGLFGANPKTGSIGVVTINMSRLGYLSTDEADYFKRLRNLMDVAKKSLTMKRKILEKEARNGLYPYTAQFLESVYDMNGAYFANHFSTIGLNGMNESIKNFFGLEESIGTKKGVEFTEKVLDFMNKVIVEYQKEGKAEDGLLTQLYNLEASPAEGAGYRLAKTDKALYPEIITAGIDEPYYTNSTQLPVEFTADAFEALDKQNEIQSKYTGGTIQHVYIAERITGEAAKQAVKKITDHYKIPYIDIVPTFSVCEDHGYIPGEEFECPTCEKETEVWTKVVGFYRPVQNFNDGRKEEFFERVEYEL